MLSEFASLVVGPESAFEITDQISTITPHETTITAWQIRMDLLTLLWEREQLTTDDICQRYLCADMSPVARYHWLCAREETVRFKQEAIDTGSLAKDYTWTTLRLTPSMLGLGESAVPSIGAHLIRSLFA